jgi:integrase
MGQGLWNADSDSDHMRVVELAKEFLDHAKSEYRFSQQVVTFRGILRPLVREFGMMPISQFGPRRLCEFQSVLVRDGRTRQGINKALTLVRQVFRWGVEMEYVPSTQLTALQAVRPLRKGRTDAPESPRRDAVPDDVVEATLPHIQPMLADMIRVQRATGMRPGEVVGLTMRELDRSGDVWVYRPEKHKCAWRESVRSIDIGPKAQAILANYFRADGLPLFSPQDAMAQRRKARRAVRKTRVQPSQVDRRKDDPEVSPGQQYTRLAYGRAISRACERAGVPKWSPNQLRKAKAVEVLTHFDMAHAQAVLGHADKETTARFYAREDRKRSNEVARLLG